MGTGNGTRVIQFGIFEADLRAGELRRNGAKIRLQEQPFQILAMLLEHPGEVVTREELRSHLWPVDTFVDFDHSLNAAVRRLRDTLGDTAENPRFVETVARRGYRFLAPVTGVTGNGVANNGQSNGTPSNGTTSTGRASSGMAGGVVSETFTSAKPTRKGLIAGAAAVLLLLGLGMGLFVGKRTSLPSLPSPPITERRLTANPSEDPVSSAAISSDGKYLAFSDDTGFYLRQVDTGETHPLTLPEGFKAKPVGWFPDGTHILATSVDGPASEPGLWQLSSLGGSPRKLSDKGREGTVSPDGSQIVFLKGAPKSQELWLMDANGGGARKLAGELGDFFRSPVWSSDGKQVAFVRGVYHPGTLDVEPQLEILDLASNERRVVLKTRLGPAMAWVGDSLVYVLAEAPPSQNDSNLWSMKIDARTGKPLGPAKRLTSAPGFIQYLTSSADGKRLAYIKEGWQPDVYVARLEANGTKLSTPKRLTLDERQDFPWSWTPDSKQILFGSDRDGAFHIFRQGVEQATPELLVGGGEQSMLPRLTPDGKQIVYLQYRLPFDGSDIVKMLRIAVTGGPAEPVLEGRAITNQQCARLPSTLCLYSQVEGRRMNFFSFDPIRGKGPEITHIEDDMPYFYNWTLSPDGATLAMAKKMEVAAEPRIRLLSLKDGKERSITLMKWSSIGAIDWSADGRSLWVSASTSTGTNAILNVDLQGKVRPMWEQTKMTVGWAIPSPDGKYLAMWQASGNSNVWMIEKF